MAAARLGFFLLGFEGLGSATTCGLSCSVTLLTFIGYSFCIGRDIGTSLTLKMTLLVAPQTTFVFPLH